MARPSIESYRRDVVDVAARGRIDAPEWATDEDLPESLDGVISWLQDVREKIPLERRPTAKVEVDEYRAIIVTYKRPMTDAEAQQAMEYALSQQMNAADHERAIYERLKRKYGP